MADKLKGEAADLMHGAAFSKVSTALAASACCPSRSEPHGSLLTPSTHILRYFRGRDTRAGTQCPASHLCEPRVKSRASC